MSGIYRLREIISAYFPSDVLISGEVNIPNEDGGIKRVLDVRTPDGSFSATVTIYTRPDQRDIGEYGDIRWKP